MLVLPLALVAAVAPAQDRYRDGQPAVITARPSEPPRARPLPWAQLDRALGHAQQRRVALFWDVALEGDVATYYDRVETEDMRVATHASGSDETLLDDEGSHRFVDGDGTISARRQRRERVEPTNGSRSDDALPLANRAAEMQFMQELRAGGVRFVDRTLVTRLAGARFGGEAPNQQAYEIGGLAQHADLVLQVTSHADAQADGRRLYLVTLRDLRSGQSLFEFMSRGSVPMAPERGYVPGKDGFVKPAPRRPSASETVRQLAIETGEHMLAALRATR